MPPTQTGALKRALAADQPDALVLKLGLWIPRGTRAQEDWRKTFDPASTLWYAVALIALGVLMFNAGLMRLRPEYGDPAPIREEWDLAITVYQRTLIFFLSMGFPLAWTVIYARLRIHDRRHPKAAREIYLASIRPNISALYVACAPLVITLALFANFCTGLTICELLYQLTLFLETSLAPDGPCAYFVAFH